MDLNEKHAEGIDVPSLFQPPDANDCEQVGCRNCEELRDRLKKLSYCLAVAQRLSDIQAV